MPAQPTIDLDALQRRFEEIVRSTVPNSSTTTTNATGTIGGRPRGTVSETASVSAFEFLRPRSAADAIPTAVPADPFTTTPEYPQEPIMDTRQKAVLEEAMANIHQQAKACADYLTTTDARRVTRERMDAFILSVVTHTDRAFTIIQPELAAAERRDGHDGEDE